MPRPIERKFKDNDSVLWEVPEGNPLQLRKSVWLIEELISVDPTYGNVYAIAMKKRPELKCFAAESDLTAYEGDLLSVE